MVVPELDSHSDVDERRAPLLQSLNDETFTCSLIDADKDEAHLLQFVDRVFIDEVVVRDNLFPHPGINTSEVIDFHLLLAQLIERRRAGTPKCIVVQENIA